MEVRERLYDIDDLWQIACDAEDDARYELIEGELIEMAPVGGEHGTIAGEIFHLFRLYDPPRALGVPTVETGYHPANDRRLLLSPDVAFTRKPRATFPLPRRFVPFMPDLAVEIQSPSDSLTQLRRKAAIYLRHGTRLVWLVMPGAQSVEICRLGADGDITSQLITRDGALSGEDLLPGFSLPLRQLFTW